jgi:hypothetical protein
MGPRPSTVANTLVVVVTIDTVSISTIHPRTIIKGLITYGSYPAIIAVALVRVGAAGATAVVRAGLAGAAVWLILSLRLFLTLVGAGAAETSRARLDLGTLASDAVAAPTVDVGPCWFFVDVVCGVADRRERYLRGLNGAIARHSPLPASWRVH